MMGFKTCSQNKNILTNLYLHIWSITKKQLNFPMDDFEKHHNFEIQNKIGDVNIMIIIYNSFIYLIFQNKNLKLTTKYLNINYSKISPKF